MFNELSMLFKETVCQSQCIDTLKLYFNELPIKEQLENESMQSDQDDNAGCDANTENVKRTRESVREEVSALIDRYVIGKVSFPMMQECMATVQVFPRNDGTHAFLFTDDIYAFLVRIEKINKGHPKRIIVRSYVIGHATEVA